MRIVFVLSNLKSGGFNIVKRSNQRGNKTVVVSFLKIFWNHHRFFGEERLQFFSINKLFETIQFSIEHHPCRMPANEICCRIGELQFFSFVRNSWVIISRILTTHKMKLYAGTLFKHLYFSPRGFAIIAHLEKQFAFHFLQSCSPALFHVGLNLLLHQNISFLLVINLAEKLFGFHHFLRDIFEHGILAHTVTHLDKLKIAGVKSFRELARIFRRDTLMLVSELSLFVKVNNEGLKNV